MPGWVVGLALVCLGSSCGSVKLPGVVKDVTGKGKGNSGGKKKSDSVETGIHTDEMIEAEPYGFRVQWIEWDSHFRGTKLRIGDRIIGVNGERYRREGRRESAPLAIGGYLESTHWERERAGDGDKVTLTVWRRGKTFEVKSKLRAERFYYTSDERRAMGPGGPDRLKNDGFSGPWAMWDEKRVKFAIRVLDGGWQSNEVREEVEEFLEENGYPQAEAAHESAEDSLGDFVSSTETAGQKTDAGQFESDVMRALDAHLKETQKVYAVFVAANEEKFFGAVGPDVIDMFAEPDVWDRERGTLRDFALDRKLREYKDGATHYFGVDLSGLTREQRDDVTNGLRGVIDELVRELNASGRSWRDVYRVIEEERESVKDKLR